MRASGWGAILLFVVAGCTPDPAPVKEPKPHPYFPIAAGSTHALGRTTADGVIKCTTCHAITDTNYAQFECVGCHEHAQDVIDPAHFTVEGYAYASSACWSCHRDGSVNRSDPSQDVAVVGLVPTWSGTTIVGLSPLDQLLPMRMNHASTQIPSAASDCATCHPDAAQSRFYPAQFHGTLLSLSLPQPTTCSECHAASSPVGFVGPFATLPARTPASGEMRHDAVALDGGAVVTADCGTCHVAPSASAGAGWSTKANFHAALSAASRAQPGACLDCHANTRPAGVLTFADAGVPRGVAFDHSGAIWLGECASCHAAGFSAWAGGKFHLAGDALRPSCLPCHAGERPTNPDAGFSGPPFDFGTNARGVTHGAGQDCVKCHQQTQAWDGGNFVHDSASVSGTTCVACHSTQRPTATIPANACLDAGFDHALSGTGDCFGCHTNTTQFAALGDWACGNQYPGAFLMASTDQFITVNEITLKHGGPNNLVIGTATAQATLYNAMLHTSAAVPIDAGIAPGPGKGDSTTCWHCHTAAPGTDVVTSYLGGQFHKSLDNYQSSPDAGAVPLAQPTQGCIDCHSNMRPEGIVQRSTLEPMDHFAKFKSPVSIKGTAVTRVSDLDCSVCHSGAGGGWDGGTLHASIASAGTQLQDCTVCHFTLMADAAKVDVISAASPSYKMKHRSTQLTFQKCDTCHPGALSPTGAIAGWSPGAFHPSLTSQPGACVDCHAGVTNPTHVTQSTVAYKGDGQWMSHTVAEVAAKDCAFCHAADAKASGGKWSPSTRLHLPGLTLGGCQGCHGAANGGTANNVPSGNVSSTTITTASAATGTAGRHDEISHGDVNVTAHDCNFCHRQQGASAGGEEWAKASFHLSFTGGDTLEVNGTTGRCSNCHLNVKPTASFTAQDHAAFDATSPTDCSSCHGWPGTGGPSSPSWRLTSGPPPTITVGGFSIAQPPAANATTVQAGITSLAHPAVPTGGSCASCHTQSGGGRGAFGYDHALAPATGCAACHEAGSDLVGKPWVLNAAGATQTTAQCNRGGGTVLDRGGDTRPVGIPVLACSAGASGIFCGAQTCAANHFYPSDCGECHLKPAATPATNQTGAGFVGNWKFQHYFGAPAQQSTCCRCHAAPNCRG